MSLDIDVIIITTRSKIPRSGSLAIDDASEPCEYLLFRELFIKNRKFVPKGPSHCARITITVISIMAA